MDKQKLSEELVQAKGRYPLEETLPLGYLHKDSPRAQRD